MWEYLKKLFYDMLVRYLKGELPGFFFFFFWRVVEINIWLRTYILLSCLILIIILWGMRQYPHFVGEQTEAEKDVK